MAEKRKVEYEISAKDNASAAFKSVQKSMDDAGAAFGKITAVLAAGGVAVGFVASMRNVAEAGDKISKAAEKFGIGAESLSALRFAAQSAADVDFNELQSALQKLSTNAAAAASGATEQGAAFEAMGIKVANSSGQLKATDALLREIAGKFSGYADGPSKAALAVELFGKSGAALIPLLNKLAESEEEAKRLGVIYSGQLAKASAAFNDNLTRMNALMQANKIAMASDVIPWVNTLIERWLEATRIGGGFAGALKLLAQQKNVFASPAENIRTLQAEIAKLEQGLENLNPNVDTGFRAKTQERIEGLRKQIEWEKALQRQQASALGGTDTPGERARMGVAALGDAPLVRKPDPAAAAELARLVKLYEEIQRIGASIDANVPPFTKNRDELEQLKKLLEDGRKSWIAYAEAVFESAAAEGTAAAAGESFTQFAEKLRDKTLELIDPQHQYNKELADLKTLLDTDYLSAEQFAEAQRRLRENSPFGKTRQEFIDLIDPIEKYRKQLEQVRDLEEKGLLTKDQATEAIFRINEQIEAVQGLDKAFEKVDDTAREFGHAIGTAFEDAVTKGKKFSDVLQALAADISRILLRKTVTKPLEDAISGFDLGGLFGKLFGNGGGPELLNSFSPRASGGSVTAGRGYIVGEERAELFVPGSSGYVFPEVPTGDGARGVTVVQHIKVDSRSDRLSINHAMAVSRQESVRAMEDLARRRTRR